MKPPVLNITKTGDLYAVQSITLYIDPSTLFVTGQAGQMLYRALAGHRWGSHPNTANVLIATHARAFIQAYGSQSGAMQGQRHGYDIAQTILQERQFNVANRVVQHWGEFIKPWLGMKMVDQWGQVVECHRCYNQQIPLPRPEPWGEFNAIQWN